MSELAGFPASILRISFLEYYGLLAKSRKLRLSEPSSGNKLIGLESHNYVHGIIGIYHDTTSDIQILFIEFPQITKSFEALGTVIESNGHHTGTSGPLVTPRTRRLAADELEIANCVRRFTCK